MKSESYILNSQAVLNLALTRCKELELDGRTKLTLSDAGSKSGRQRSLNWMWNDEVSKSGLGGKHEDSKQGVHMVAKYRWAVPILQRDDPNFADLYGIWTQLYGKDPDRMLYFIDNHVHTERMSISQVAEFLTDFQRYYLDKGVSLTNPDDLKLLSYEES